MIVTLYPLTDILSRQMEEAFVADELRRAERFRQAWEAYHGRFPQSLRIRPGQPDDNVVVNFVRAIVDKGVSFLFGSGVEFELDETQETPAEEWLAECWEANRKMTLLHKLALNGAVCGHTFVKIIEGQPYPRLIVLDPATVSVRWAPDDIEQVLEYRIQYPAIDPETGRAIVRRQTITRQGAIWRIVEQEARGDGGRWVTLNEANWPYGWAPILDCQNLPEPNEFWGVPDIEEDLVALNRSINFVLSNLVRIIRYHAHPKTWGRGFTAQQLNIAADETIVLPSADAELHNLEMQSDLASSLALYERLREALFLSARVPEVATGKLDRAGALSGVALNILYQPLLEKTETKRRTYGDMLVELNRRLLALGGFGEENRTVIHWPELLPGDPRAEAETSVLLQQLGVSQDTLLQRLGFDPDLERQKREAGSAELGEQLLTAFERGA